MKSQMPEGSRFQCPACGTPVTTVDLPVKRNDIIGTGLLLEDCGHTVSLDVLRDAWGIDIPEPDPTRVVYPTGSVES